MINNLVRELEEYQRRIAATENQPNELYDKVKWSVLSELRARLGTLSTNPSQKELDKVDAKSR